MAAALSHFSISTKFRTKKMLHPSSSPMADLNRPSQPRRTTPNSARARGSEGCRNPDGRINTVSNALPFRAKVYKNQDVYSKCYKQRPHPMNVIKVAMMRGFFDGEGLDNVLHNQAVGCSIK